MKSDQVILTILAFTLLLQSKTVVAGALRVISPKIGETRDLSTEARKRYEAEESHAEDGEDFFDITGNGCSWYCGGEVTAVRASSELMPQGKLTYLATNAHDDSLATAWVEGKEGAGIGEWIEYELPPQEPRITTIRIFNGMVKSEKLWKANSRIKELKLTVNRRPYATLRLEDTPAQQNFEMGVIEPPDPTKPLVLRFTIMSVYPGEKHADTCLAELYFDGVGVH